MTFRVKIPGLVHGKILRTLPNANLVPAPCTASSARIVSKDPHECEPNAARPARLVCGFGTGDRNELGKGGKAQRRARRRLWWNGGVQRSTMSIHQFNQGAPMPPTLANGKVCYIEIP